MNTLVIQYREHGYMNNCFSVGKMDILEKRQFQWLISLVLVLKILKIENLPPFLILNLARLFPTPDVILIGLLGATEAEIHILNAKTPNFPPKSTFFRIIIDFEAVALLMTACREVNVNLAGDWSLLMGLGLDFCPWLITWLSQFYIFSIVVSHFSSW